MITRKQVNTFTDDLFEGKYNHRSKYISEMLSYGMSDYEESHHVRDIEDDPSCFSYIMICCCILKRSDVIKFFLNRDKHLFKTWLFDLDSCLYDYRDGELPDLSEMLDLMISYDVEIDYGELMKYCCKNGNVSLIRHIVEIGLYKCIPECQYLYVLFAILKKECQTLEYLFDELKFDINKVSHKGNSYLHSTIYNHSSKKIIRILIERGIDVNIKNLQGQKASEITSNVTTKKLIEDYSNEPIKEPEYD